MTIYRKSNNPGAAGCVAGILLLDYHGPFVPGDVGNASSYRYPVLYRTVPGATSARVFAGDPALVAGAAEAAAWLVERGVQFVTSDCGFFLAFQDQVAAAVHVPVALSSLLQLPLVQSMIGPRRRVAILAANAKALDPKLLALAGATSTERLVIRGLESEPVFGGSVTGGCTSLDTEALQGELVGVAVKTVQAHPDIGAFLIECSMLPPYSRAIQDATGLPVFDFLTMIDQFQTLTARPLYQ